MEGFLDRQKSLTEKEKKSRNSCVFTDYSTKNVISNTNNLF